LGSSLGFEYQREGIVADFEAVLKVARSESDAIWDGQFWYSASITVTKTL